MLNDKTKKNKIGSTHVSPLTLWSWAHDWDNLKKKEWRKKSQRSISTKINVKWWNREKINLNIKETKINSC